MTERTFVAFEHELEQLWRFLSLALSEQGQICFVVGEAGSGKTTLVAEFARRVQEAHADLVVAIGTCNAQTGIGDPYLPFREVLGLLTGDVDVKLAQGAITSKNAERLRRFLQVSGQALVDLGPDLVDIFVPGVGLATRAGLFVADKTGVADKIAWVDRLRKLGERPAPVPGELEQGRIFEQYASVLHALAARQPLVLVVDDLQWADAASLSLLFHLGRGIGESRILLVGTYRPDEVALGRPSTGSGQTERHPLEKVLAELKRYQGEIAVSLDWAGKAIGRQFVEALLDAEPNGLDEAFRQALFAHTGGHPLFTVELLRDLRERGDLVRDDQDRWVEAPTLDWATLPARVEGIVEERIGRLEEHLRDVLSVASVEGTDFTAQVVARVEEVRERQLLRQLSQELEKRHHLVREQEEIQVGRQFLSRYEFAHALFQQYLYDELGAGERRMLHGEVAAVLEELYQEHTDEIVVQLARHYAEAGMGEKAIGYLLQAGDRARGLYAYQEAIGYYQRALEFLRKQRDHERTARTLMKLGLTYHIAFDFRGARQAYEEGFALWQRAGEAEPADGLPSARHALRIDWPYPPLTLDPTRAGDIDSTGIIDQLFSGLVTLGPEMDVLPDVAHSWDVLEDGRRYVFRLRPDVQWSDGTPVTAEDFAYAWRRVLDPGSGALTASLLYDIRGARAFHQGEAADVSSLGIQTADEETLVVELAQPTSHFLYLLAYNASYPVPRHVVEAHGEEWTAVEHIVTNGPFRLVSWTPDKAIVLKHNPRYHDRRRGNVRQVTVSLLSDWSARLEQYQAGGLNTLSLWDLRPDRDRARQQHADEYLAGPHMSTLAVGFDVRRPPFDDPRVRRAFAQAVDRERLADVVLHGYEFPATGGFLPPGMPGHSPGIGLAYDPAQAQALLAEAGYSQGRDFPPVKLLTDQGRDVLNEYLQTQWRENLGVEVLWQAVGWEEMMEQLEQSPPHLFLFAWAADYPDPDNYLRVCDGLQRTGWQNQAYERLVQEARQLTDQRQRVDRYRQADRILIEEAAIMPFTYGRLHLLVQPWVRRFPTSAIKWWYWKDVVVEPP